MKFMGFSRTKDAIDGVKQAQSWEGLLAGWRQEVDTLAQGFAYGDARVEPKNGLATCSRCDLQTLCRVYERLSPLSLDEEKAE